MTISDFELTWTDGEWPADDAAWVPAIVPGGVHESLLAAGLLKDPYFGQHEHDLAWVDAATWWYRARVSGGPGTLRFAGLDTVAEVFVDGQPVGSARNQHRAHEFPFTTDPGDHELVVRFPPPLECVLSEEDAQPYVDSILARQARVRPQDPAPDVDDLLLRLRRVRLRKATFSWGWDFAPVVTSRGISGPVSLGTTAPPARVQACNVDLEARTATVTVTGTGPLSITVTAPEGTTARHEGSDHVEITLTDVTLWWTHDLGTPSLYDVTVNGQRHRVGFRTIELDRSDDAVEGGRHFRFLLNGVPTFSRGACWVPPSMLVASVPEATIRDLVMLSRDAGMNMLRVWGGGLHAPDAFYDACDELGVLAWQDFMFACYDYPDPDGSIGVEVRLEAAENVQRIRDHASLALWCGENEVQAIHEMTTGNADPGDWGWSFFNELLPAVVAEHDPDTAYWPGSPWGDLPGEILNGTRDGDRHAWEVWHGNDVGAGGPTDYATRGEAVHFHRYEHDKGRFISEFGIHAAPELATLERWTPPGSLTLGSDELLQRIKDTPKDKGWALMGHETGEPDNLLEYVDFSMACQAEGLKHGVEHYRRRQPHCNGTLVWQLNDSWPGLSWSVIDFDLVPKAGYYFLQRCFQPLLASFKVDGDTLELWVSNSGRTDTDLQLVVEIGPLAGGPTETHEVTVTAPAYSSRRTWTRLGVPAADQVAWVSETTGLLPANRRFFAPLKDLALRESTLSATVIESGNGAASVRLSAQGFCYLSRVTCDQPGTRFSTNYVDLRDGETVVIEVTGIAAGAQLMAAHFGAQPQRLAY